MARLRGLLLADPTIILATIVLGTIGVLVSFFDKTGNLQIRLARIWAKILLSAGGVKVRVEGLEHLEPKTSYLFIANHLSYMDTPVMLANIPVQFRFLAKSGLFKIPLLGSHLSRAGHISVPRQDARGSLKVMQQATEALRRKAISLLIFPEGGRSHDGVLQPFKEGGAHIAIKAGVPVVPTALIGTREILPFGFGVVRAGQVTLRLLKPIATNGMTPKDRGKLTEEVRVAILRELQPVAEPALQG